MYLLLLLLVLGLTTPAWTQPVWCDDPGLATSTCKGAVYPPTGGRLMGSEDWNDAKAAAFKRGDNDFAGTAAPLPQLVLERNTHDDGTADFAINILDHFTHSTQANFQVEQNGTLENWLSLNGWTSVIELGNNRSVTDIQLVTESMRVRGRDLAKIQDLPGDLVYTDQEVFDRFRFIKANALSGDSAECADPVRTQINSNVRDWALSCPHAGTEVDGFIYGSFTLPPSWSATGTSGIGDTIIRWQQRHYLGTDNGAGTWYGVLTYQCVGVDATIQSTWTLVSTADLVIADERVVGDIVQIGVDFTPTGCQANDTLFLRWKSCDTDATPSTNCTSSAGFEGTAPILSWRVRYAKTLDD